MIKTYEIKLTLEELLPLDGKVSEQAQKIINKAKQESTYGFDLPVMNEILRDSEKSGKLTWTYKQIRSCSYCDKSYDYHEYPRSGRYHRKGEKNYDKPKYYSGIKFNEGFITIQGNGDMCSECATKHNVIHRLIDYIINNDLKTQIQKNDYKFSKYIKDDIRICYKCGNEMQESEMGRERTFMGDGTFPSTCPSCKAGSSGFGNNHKTTNKFVMIKNPAFDAQEMINELKIEVEKHNSNNDIKLKLFEVYNRPNNFIIWIDDQYNKEVIKFNIDSKKYINGSYCSIGNNIFEDIINKYNYSLSKY